MKPRASNLTPLLEALQMKASRQLHSLLRSCFHFVRKSPPSRPRAPAPRSYAPDGRYALRGPLHGAGVADERSEGPALLLRKPLGVSTLGSAPAGREGISGVKATKEHSTEPKLQSTGSFIALDLA